MPKSSLCESSLTTNKHLIRWVEKMADLTQPDNIHWVDGSKEEYDRLCQSLVEAGTFLRLNQDLWPGCFYARSSPNDVARVEDRTFICSLSKDNAGPTNNWQDPYLMRKNLKALFRGSMRGRTMFVLPFSMGPVGSPMARIGVQLTDSAYAVVNMRIMARSVCSQRRRASFAGAEGCAMALQRREVHCSLSRDTRNLEFRVRLWR
jgi:phosphoenolpyruvate carboxykinase (GTP)